MDLSYVELYDITKDVYEKTDLKSSHKEVVTDLVSIIKNWLSELPKKPNSRLFSVERQNYSKL